MTTFHFEPVARLQKFLGKELIADPNLAIIEFVKNGYDALATDVYIEFRIAGKDREEQEIIISDNGEGMDRSSFEENWMRPGYSKKALSRIKAEGFREKERVPVGEKGLGRLAAGRLGDAIEISTRTNTKEPWLHVYINWQEFDTMDKPLNAIDVHWDDITSPNRPRVEKGTIVNLTGLSIDWRRKMPGRRMPGRSQYRLGRLQEDLRILLQPISFERHFNIHLKNDFDKLPVFNGTISPNKPQFFDYLFSIEISEKNGKIHLKRIIRRSESVLAVIESKEPEEIEEKKFDSLLEMTGEEGVPEKLACGPITSTLYYSPISRDRLKKFGVLPGVFLYRDGVRVEPYGQEGNDWLGAIAWKARRQGYAPIQPKFFAGHFAISRIKNPELIDMSNRQGLVDNESYRAFIAVCRHEFEWFANKVLKEYVEPGWTKPIEKAQRSAERTVTFMVTIMRSLAHSIRQSIGAIGTDLSLLKSLNDNPDIPHDIRLKIQESEARIDKHIRKINRTVGRFLAFDQESLTALENFELLDLKSLVIEVEKESKQLAKSRNVSLIVEASISKQIVFNRIVLATTLKELVSNAIEAAAIREQDGQVLVGVKKESSDKILIYIKDNGKGIDEQTKNQLLSRPVSSKGRLGIGLLLANEMLTLSGARLDYTTSGKGTEFTISIPSITELKNP